MIQAKGEYKFLAPFVWEYPLTLKDAKTVYQLAMSGDIGWGDTAAAAINKAANKQKSDNQLLSALKAKAQPNEA